MRIVENTHTHRELRLALENELLLLWKETFLVCNTPSALQLRLGPIEFEFSPYFRISECMRWSFESSVRVVWDVFSLSLFFSECVASHLTNISAESIGKSCALLWLRMLYPVCCMCGDYLQLVCVIPHGNPVISSTETHWSLNATFYLNVIKTKMKHKKSEKFSPSKSHEVDIQRVQWSSNCLAKRVLPYRPFLSKRTQTRGMSLTAYFRLLVVLFSFFSPYRATLPSTEFLSSNKIIHVQYVHYKYFCVAYGV